MSEEMVVVATYWSVVEAEAARGRLEVEGIQAAVFADDAGGMFPSLQPFTGVRLLVPSDQVDQAREVLAAVEEESEQAGGDED